MILYLMMTTITTTAPTTTTTAPPPAAPAMTPVFGESPEPVVALGASVYT